MILSKKYNPSKSVLVQVISFVMMTLMLYAGTVKLLNVPLFKEQMSKSPLIPEILIPYIGYLLPLAEILIALLIIIKRTTRMGLLLSFIVMLMFTFYLIFLTSLFENVPCSCGGILGQMSYTVHIIFNISFTILAWMGFSLYEDRG